jgi:hypothetical protein
LLDKADKAYRDKEDQKKVDQLAYLTNQRVEVAKDTIALRESEAKLKTLATNVPAPCWKPVMHRSSNCKTA